MKQTEKNKSALFYNFLFIKINLVQLKKRNKIQVENWNFQSEQSEFKFAMGKYTVKPWLTLKEILADFSKFIVLTLI